VLPNKGRASQKPIKSSTLQQKNQKKIINCHYGGGAYPSYLLKNVDKEVENGLAFSHYPQKYLFITTNVASP
jgi:hypothetical protein